MLYITKQKFKISELVDIPKPAKTILLVITEESLRQIYCRHLLDHDFQVHTAAFGDVAAIAHYLNSADLLIIDVRNTPEDDKLEFLRIFTQDFSGIPVVTVGHTLSEDSLEKIMSLGVVSHLDRKFSRPEDLVQIVKAAFINL